MSETTSAHTYEYDPSSSSDVYELLVVPRLEQANTLLKAGDAVAAHECIATIYGDMRDAFRAPELPEDAQARLGNALSRTRASLIAAGALAEFTDYKPPHLEAYFAQRGEALAGNPQALQAAFVAGDFASISTIPNPSDDEKRAADTLFLTQARPLAEAVLTSQTPPNEQQLQLLERWNVLPSEVLAVATAGLRRVQERRAYENLPSDTLRGISKDVLAQSDPNVAIQLLCQHREELRTQYELRQREGEADPLLLIDFANLEPLYIELVRQGGSPEIIRTHPRIVELRASMETEAVRPAKSTISALLSSREDAEAAEAAFAEVIRDLVDGESFIAVTIIARELEKAETQFRTSRGEKYLPIITRARGFVRQEIDAYYNRLSAPARLRTR
ncbi:MAG TPA: hypothetical protein VLF60_01005 [Candidatus Saccharimonadales bacterium]|nr:hypothetical protein [Candidatus Saccharimonadales bacterium]